uniref:Melanocortin-2 receptor accessory protein n=1 Tax=Dicentrarchus labrax TaxID=13489 RepID=A0A8C4IDL6_DICLA
MENSTSAVSYEWEYYYDYLDPVIVDESKLKYNKYSIVIIFWIILAAFVGFLFFGLNLMSRSGNFPSTRRTQEILAFPGIEVIRDLLEGTLLGGICKFVTLLMHILSLHRISQTQSLYLLF